MFRPFSLVYVKKLETLRSSSGFLRKTEEWEWEKSQYAPTALTYFSVYNNNYFAVGDLNDSTIKT